MIIATIRKWVLSSHEAVARARRFFGRDFDLRYLVYFSKTEQCKVVAWEMAQMIGKQRQLGVIDLPRYCGWRKCHTQNYWSWYAYDRVEEWAET